MRRPHLTRAQTAVATIGIVALPVAGAVVARRRVDVVAVAVATILVVAFLLLATKRR